jgi:hypothetical protein
MRQIEEVAPPLPRVQREELIGADEKDERARRSELGAQASERVEGESGRRAFGLGRIDLEPRVPAIARRIISSRCLPGVCGAARCPGLPEGIQRTRSSASASAASSARRR